jgi:hypothetical protein
MTAKIIVTLNPIIVTSVLDISSILIIDANTTPPKINFEMSRKYFPNSLLNSLSLIQRTYTAKLSPHPQVRVAFGL